MPHPLATRASRALCGKDRMQRKHIAQRPAGRILVSSFYAISVGTIFLACNSSNPAGTTVGAGGATSNQTTGGVASAGGDSGAGTTSASGGVSSAGGVLHTGGAVNTGATLDTGGQ